MDSSSAYGPADPFAVKVWARLDFLEKELRALQVKLGLREPEPVPEPPKPYVSPLRADANTE